MSSNTKNPMLSSPPNHHHITNHYQTSSNSPKKPRPNLMHKNHKNINGLNGHNKLHQINGGQINGASSKQSPSSKPSILHQSTAAFPTPISSLSTYKSPLNRKRNRNDISSQSPNINNNLKRQRRKIATKPEPEQIHPPSLPSLVSLSPEPKSKSNAKSNSKKQPQKQSQQKNTKRKTPKNGKNTRNNTKSNSRKKVSVEDWSETDQDFTEDDDYRPPKDNNKSMYK